MGGGANRKFNFLYVKKCLFREKNGGGGGGGGCNAMCLIVLCAKGFFIQVTRS